MYVANMGSEQHIGGTITGFKLNRDNGSLTPVPGSPFTGGDSPSVVTSDPQGHFVFVGEERATPGVRGSNCANFQSVLLSERVDAASGTLTLADRQTLNGSCVEAMTVDPSGKHLYLGVFDPSGSGGDIQGFLIGAAGTLTELPGSPFPVADRPTSLVMHPTGKFVYAATPNVTILDRDPATGVLKVRGVFNTPKFRFALNPAGTFMLASEFAKDEVSEFHVDPNTGDIFATESRFPASLPGAVAADPKGQFFALTEITDHSNFTGGLSTWMVNFSGEYIKTDGVFFADGVPADAAFESSGTFVYLTLSREGKLAGFTLDRSSGKLTPLSSGQVAAGGDFPVSLVIIEPK